MKKGGALKRREAMLWVLPPMFKPLNNLMCYNTGLMPVVKRSTSLYNNSLILHQCCKTLVARFSVSSPLVGNSLCPYMDVKCKTTSYITNLTRVRVTKETKSRQQWKKFMTNTWCRFIFKGIIFLNDCVKISTDSKGKEQARGEACLVMRLWGNISIHLQRELLV